MPRSLVSAQGLGRRFRAHWALAHVDLEVEPGQSLLIAGANGSGKTTLLRLVAGLLRPSRGRIGVFGLDPSKDSAAVRRRLTLVSHHAYLYESLSAFETLRLWRTLAPQAERFDDRELLSLLASVGLEKRADDPVAGFSAGMRKRLTLLRARLEDPKLVLLDEPFAALDPAGQDLIESWIAGFTERGITVLVASHALDRASRVCSDALLLERGQIVWRGASDGLASVVLRAASAGSARASE